MTTKETLEQLKKEVEGVDVKELQNEDYVKGFHAALSAVLELINKRLQ